MAKEKATITLNRERVAEVQRLTGAPTTSAAIDLALILLGGFAAGGANAIAGGGTFFSFPALLAVGVPPVVANASNSVALWPGSVAGAWAYRAELARFSGSLWPMVLTSLVGGVAGGLILLAAGDARFSALIP